LEENMAGPFDKLRTDQVGSLLRPEQLKSAWAEFDRGELDERDLAVIQADAVADVIGAQVSLGISPVTDGEFWRRGFQETFVNSVSGYAVAGESGSTSAEAGGQVESGIIPETTYVRRQAVTERVLLSENRLLEEFTRDVRFTDRPVKVTLTGPERITQRFDLEHSGSIYDDFDDFMGDVIAIEHQMIAEVIAAGCQYVGIDEPAYTAYVDPASLQWMSERNWDPAAGLTRAIAADNAVIAGFPETTFGLHICRGNGGGAWHRQGFYDDIAEEVFGELNYERLLLEYDTERAGGFEPLRFVPKGRVAVLGLISTKTAEVESVDEVVRRIDEASKFLPLDQLALSPQCGFASGIAGNPLSRDAQWRKLELMHRVADRVWG
jgi:5-methyltetrahydropteroyltriglutamate--homocysteine methyltransferase